MAGSYVLKVDFGPPRDKQSFLSFSHDKPNPSRLLEAGRCFSGLSIVVAARQHVDGIKRICSSVNGSVSFSSQRQDAAEVLQAPLTPPYIGLRFAYCTATVKLADLITLDFLQRFVHQGSLAAVQADTSIAHHSCFALYPDGRLVLSLDQETYEKAGLTGSPSRAQKGRRIVVVNLRDKALATRRSRQGARDKALAASHSRLRKRLEYAATNALNQSHRMNITFTPHGATSPTLKDVCQHLGGTMQFADQVYNKHSGVFIPDPPGQLEAIGLQQISKPVCDGKQQSASDQPVPKRPKKSEQNPQRTVLRSHSVRGPDPSAKSTSSRRIRSRQAASECQAFDEWLGMALLDCIAPQSRQPEHSAELAKYINSWEPELAAASNKGSVETIRWRGLIRGTAMESIVEAARTLATSESDDVVFVAITLHGYPHVPMGLRDKEHSYFYSGDNDQTLVLHSAGQLLTTSINQAAVGQV